MADISPHLLLPYLVAAQAQKHVTHNEALRLLDALVQLSVLNLNLTAPPVSPKARSPPQRRCGDPRLRARLVGKSG